MMDNMEEEDTFVEDHMENVMEEDLREDEEEIEHSADIEAEEEEDPNTSLPDDEGAPLVEHTPDTTVPQAVPRKIKRPSSAWIIFLAQNRPIVKSAHPELRQVTVELLRSVVVSDIECEGR